jgi:phosphate transport system permease protein
MESADRKGKILEDQSASRKRKIKDFFAAGTTYFFSSFTLIALIAIIVFIFAKGWSTLSWSFLTGDYKAEVCSVETSADIPATENTFSYSEKSGEYFSFHWGIAFEDAKSNEGLPTVEVSYVDPKANISSWTDSSTGKPFTLTVFATVSSAQLWTTSDPDTASVLVASGSEGAEKMRDAFEEGTYLKVMTVTEGGGGIRGSVISTLYMILLTMAVALPLGIGGAIYLGVYARKNRITDLIRTLIDMISGIPSIIFGLVGGILFLPIVGGKGNLISGSLTLACMILPIIIKSTEETIRTLPKSMPLASLALGASETQTTFRIILPNSLPGIFTSALLGIGRVIGESAALVYTSGTAIQDVIIPTEGSATLAVHIWALMAGENPNITACCAVSIVILFVILLLSLLVKLLSFRISRQRKAQ